MNTTESLLLSFAIAGLVFVVGRRIWGRQRGGSPAASRFVSSPRFGKWTVALAGVIPTSREARKQLTQELNAVGQYKATALNDFLAYRNLIVLATTVIVAFALAVGLADRQPVPFAISSCLLCIAAYSVPRVVLSARAARCIGQIEKGIPDALDIMAMAVAGGIPLEAAVARTARQLAKSNRRLADELSIVARQAAIGSVERAFTAFGSRVDVPEVSAWCALMAQSRRLGGRLVDSLNDYANRVRDDRRNRAERQGNTASIKLLLPVITCLSPPIAIMLIGPALLDLRDFVNRRQSEEATVVRSAESGMVVE
jgi:tight adherence protein C